MEWKEVVRDVLLVWCVLMCILFPFGIECGDDVIRTDKPQCRVCVDALLGIGDPRPSPPLHPIMAAIMDGYWH